MAHAQVLKIRQTMSFQMFLGKCSLRQHEAAWVMQEKDQMLKYVEEEVDRVKGLFEQKEARLTGERDSAKQAAQQLAAEREELTQKLLRLEQQLRTFLLLLR